MMPLTLILFARTLASVCLATAGDSLTAGDLARAVPVFSRLPAATILGWAPAPGTRRVLESPDLSRLAARHGLTLPGPPPRLCLTQPAAPPSRTALEAALASAAPPGWRIELEDWSRAPLPAGDITFDPRALPRLPRAAAIRPVLWRGVLAAGHRRYPVWARVRLSVERERLEAREKIRSGEPLAPSALALVTAAEYPLWAPACQRVEQTAGQQLRRTLAAGDAIEPRFLAPAPAVRRGEQVAIEITAGSAHLQIQAVAEAPARAGQIVLVKNPLNGRRFPARVTSPGRAEAVTAPHRENP